MATPHLPVPNVRIENPKVRKVARTILDVTGLAVGVVVLADAGSPAFDVTAYTLPTLTVYAYLRGAFGLGVDNPNTPTP